VSKQGARASASPRSIAGRWLVVCVLGQWELLDRLSAQWEGPARPDEVAVLQHAATMALRAHLGKQYDVRAVTAFAASLWGSWRFTQCTGLIDLEALLRWLVGDDDVDLAGLSLPAMAEAYSYSVGQVARLQEWDKRTVNDLVARAEAVAFRQGYKPQLAAGWGGGGPV
jgi:hypothetical protein